MYYAQNYAGIIGWSLLIAIYDPISYYQVLYVGIVVFIVVDSYQDAVCSLLTALLLCEYYVFTCTMCLHALQSYV